MHTNQDDLSHSKPKGLHVSQEIKLERKEDATWYDFIDYCEDKY